MQKAIDQAIADRVEPSADWTNYIAAAHAKNGDRTSAMNILQENSNNQPYIQSSTLAVIAECFGDDKEAFKWVEKQREKIPRYSDYLQSAFAMMAVNVGEYSKACSLASCINENKKALISVVVAALARKGEIAYAEKLCGSIQYFSFKTLMGKHNSETVAQVKADVKAKGVENIDQFNNLMEEYMKKYRDPQWATSLIAEMEAVGVAPDLVTYEIIFLGIDKRYYNDSFVMMEHMRLRGVVASNTIFTAVMFSYAREGAELGGLIKQIEALGLQLNELQYYAIVYGLAKGKDLGRMARYKNVMLKQRWIGNVVMWGAVIEAYANAGKMELAMREKKTMEKTYNIKADFAIYSFLIKGYAKLGDMKNADKMVQEMKERGFTLPKMC